MEFGQSGSKGPEGNKGSCVAKSLEYTAVPDGVSIKDDDTCLKASGEGWHSYACAESRTIHHCVGYARTLQRCCPKSCHVVRPTSFEECLQLGTKVPEGTKGSCVSKSLQYTTIPASLGTIEDSDTCLQASGDGWKAYTCNSVNTIQHCVTYARTVQRCCPKSCHVVPPLSYQQCMEFGNSGTKGPEGDKGACVTKSLVYTAVPQGVVIQDSDSCLQDAGNGWQSYTCSKAATKHHCVGYARIIQRCCPQTCHVVPPRNVDECNALGNTPPEDTKGDCLNAAGKYYWSGDPPP